MIMQMEDLGYKKGFIGLSDNKVTMLDSIIDPFGTASDQMSFQNVEKVLDYNFGQDDEGLTCFTFVLHGKRMI